jgi:hypothetical protein
MQSSYQKLTEMYYEHMIHKGDVPSFQCEMNNRWSNSVKEEDDPRSIFIDFNVSALAPHLN